MDTKYAVIVLIGLPLLTIFFKGFGKYPILQRLGGSGLSACVLLLVWMAVSQVAVESTQLYLISALFGCLFLLSLVWIWEPFKKEIRRVIAVAIAAAILLDIVILVVI